VDVAKLIAGAASVPVYAKWQGAHWVLAALADIGHPPGDPSLLPLRDRVLSAWLAVEPPLLDGRYRAHASQPGNALRSLIKLGLADERCDALAAMLLNWQWPDGGWNCDRHLTAAVSSFHETLLPMRGLWAYGGEPCRAAARRAAEVFLRRRLLYRVSTGALIRDDFAKLHFPRYWHYDVLGGLVAMMEMGLLADPRCADALELLASMRVGDGWPAHATYARSPNRDSVDWGGASTRRANPWVTAEASAVLRAAALQGANIPCANPPSADLRADPPSVHLDADHHRADPQSALRSPVPQTADLHADPRNAPRSPAPRSADLHAGLRSADPRAAGR
jgi:hypothetical protein